MKFSAPALTKMGKCPPLTGSGFEDTVFQARMCAPRGSKGATASKCIAIIPGLSMNVLQKLLKDCYEEYILHMPDEIKDYETRITGINM